MRSFFDLFAFTLFAILATAALTLALPLTIARAGWRLFAVGLVLACGSAVYADGCGLAVVRSRIVVAPQPVIAVQAYAAPVQVQAVVAQPVCVQQAVAVQAVAAYPVVQQVVQQVVVQRAVVQRVQVQRVIQQRQVIRSRQVIRGY